MNTRTAVAASATCTFIAAIALAVVGCKRESSSETESRPARVAGKPTLQAEINALRQTPVERTPANRPVAVSRPASTPRDWALGALRDGYFQTGQTNRNWDAQVLAAFEAYSDYSRNFQFGRWGAITNSVLQAQAAGCHDPMVEYLNVRYSQGAQNDTEEKLAINLVRACRALAISKHHPAFKFVAAYRAISAAREADPTVDRAILQLLVNNALVDLARDSNAPPSDVFQGAFEWLAYTRNKGWADFVMGDLDGMLQINWPNDPRLYCLKGTAEVQRAWEARGGSWADTVSEKGWEGFGEHLKSAESLLSKSWELAPTNAFTAYEMMQVELGQGRGRPIMEQWFKRAMALATNYYDAVKLMSFYLEPRWYGSKDDSLAFARSCVSNNAWGGSIPLILPDVHHSLAKFYNQAESAKYWQRPGVWDDVRSAYERFFATNPSAIGWRHDYARDAYLCGQYDVFLAQTKLFTGGTNHAFFGGEAKFQEMLRKAAAASKMSGS